MNAKTIPVLIIVAILAGISGWFAAKEGRFTSATSATATDPAARKIKFYQSPMHPWIKSDKPGKCTICGMTLVPVYEGEEGIATNSNLITLTPGAATAVGVQTSEIMRGPLVHTLRVTGIIDDDETRHRYLSSYTDARIDKLFVNTTGVEVTAGQPLAVLYSPDLLTARQEFHALATTTPDSPLVAAAREKLRRLGLLDTQIDALALPGNVPTDTEILAPKTGTVVERSPTAYEGGYVKAGEMLFAVGDFKVMWFMADVYEADFPFLKTATHVEVTVPSLPGKVFSAPINFIDPNLDPATRTAKVRVILDNTDRHFFHRQTAYARIVSTSPNVLLVPRSAVLFTRSEPVVYVDQGGHAYEAHPVKLGRAGDDSYEVLSGLDAGDEVVTEGALLIDGQAQITQSSQGDDSKHAGMNMP
ncbi:MAG TPA: efflux RND transporter periplasmic adaptor subunit [Rariglobus sp.]|jgi:Cu(I)/Ag(I) efflux system membrane fusion protein|nr:efflux RND transporter periplasmic adaptor subunit [Rariglobus sp.]